MLSLQRIGRVVAVLATLATMAACAPQQELFVVFPNADGTSGAISVNNGQGATTLDRPYATAEVRDNALAPAPPQPGTADVIFRSAFSSRPIPPRHFTLNFENGSSELTPEAVKAYHDVFEDAHRRPAYQVEVIGYTDTVGDQASNQTLSLQRAGAIRERLIHDGIASDAITTAGRGKLDLLVKTADQVPEARNRRVDITVR